MWLAMQHSLQQSFYNRQFKTFCIVADCNVSGLWQVHLFTSGQTHVNSVSMHFGVAVGMLPLSLSQKPTCFPMTTNVNERAASPHQPRPSRLLIFEALIRSQRAYSDCRANSEERLAPETDSKSVYGRKTRWLYLLRRDALPPKRGQKVNRNAKQWIVALRGNKYRRAV